MSVPQRLRTNFLTGTISSLPAGSTTLTFTAMSSALGNITSIISGTNYLPLIINPASYGSTSTPAAEVVWVVGYTGGQNATVMRGQEGTTANTSNWTTNTVFVNGPLTNDFGITNQIANGDFPLPTASGQYLTASAGGASSPVWASGVPATAITPGAFASGVTISGTQVIGAPNQIISQYTASGTNQGSAIAITTQYATVTGATATAISGAGKGVILPPIVTSGQAITIDNTDPSHWLLIFPASGQSIDGAGNNNSVWIAPSAYWYGVAENGSNWATVVPSLNSGIGVNATYGNANVTFSSALSMVTVTSGSPVTLSGFNNYLVLVNGYGSKGTGSGYLVTTLNYNGNPIVVAQTVASGNAYYSLSNMTTVSSGTGAWTATVTNANYSNGGGSAIVIGIN